MSASVDIASLQKAIKGATKPKDAPPKEKYLLAVQRCLAHDDEAAFAQLSQLLLPKLEAPSLVVALKAHLVVHHLVSDDSLKKYAFLRFISRYYTSQQRSSVCMMGPAVLPLEVVPNTNTTTTSSSHQPKKASLTANLFRRPATNNSAALDELASKSKQPFLPNLAHSLSQSAEQNRLLSAYNRYLRERVLHYRQLKLDPIREKVHGTSIVDSPEEKVSSEALLAQIQCVVQQIRLLLDCIFPPAFLDHPLYAYCYGMVAKDLSILTRFLNLALVMALESFFTLSRANAEAILFIYKEYTQLQVCDEVCEFVGRAPTTVDPKDLAIQPELPQDPKAVHELTKSLENYLFQITSMERAATLSSQKMSGSDSSDLHSERKSYLSVSSVSTIASPVHTVDHYSRPTPPLEILSMERQNSIAARRGVTDLKNDNLKSLRQHYLGEDPDPLPLAVPTTAATDVPVPPRSILRKASVASIRPTNKSCPHLPAPSTPDLAEFVASTFAASNQPQQQPVRPQLPPIANARKSLRSSYSKSTADLSTPSASMSMSASTNSSITSTPKSTYAGEDDHHHHGEKEREQWQSLFETLDNDDSKLSLNLGFPMPSESLPSTPTTPTSATTTTTDEDSQTTTTGSRRRRLTQKSRMKSLPRLNTRLGRLLLHSQAHPETPKDAEASEEREVKTENENEGEGEDDLTLQVPRGVYADPGQARVSMSDSSVYSNYSSSVSVSSEYANGNRVGLSV